MTSSKMLLAAAAVTISAVDAAVAAGNLRSHQAHGRALGYCGWGCENGSYRGWWDSVRRYCTCDTNWEDRCCDTYNGPCTQGMDELCDQDKLVHREFAVDNLLKNGLYNGPITLGTAAHGLPANMQGVFWLQGQEDSSSLVSFAPSRDGDGLSDWNGNSDRQISVRVGGDRVWSFASEGKSWELVEGIDLVYNFEGTDADGKQSPNPVHWDIIPEAKNLGLELSGPFLEFALNFQMNFIEEGAPEHEYPATATRPAAVQWGRPSVIFGVNANSAYYQVAQVIDGSGNPTAAYDAWVAYNHGSEAWKDGTIHYHEAVWPLN